MSDLREARRQLLQRFRGRRDRYLLETRTGVTQVRERVTLPLLDAHLEGRKRIGLFCPPDRGVRWLRFDFDGKAPKRRPIGKGEAWSLVQRVVNVLVMDLNMPAPLIELTRSGEGYAAYLFFEGDLPAFEEIESFAKAVLREAGLPDDLADAKGHVGLRPCPPGSEGVGQTCFLPLCGFGNGAKTSIFVRLEDGTPHEDQLGALSAAPQISGGDIRRALEQLPAEGSSSVMADTVGVKAFSIDNWINTYLSVETTGAKPWANGPRCWGLHACPWSDRHTDPRDTSGAYIAEMNSGAIVAGCKHASCTWTWRDLRERFDPSWTRARTQDGLEAARIIPVDVFSVAPSVPFYRVEGLIQKGGVSLTWATRGGCKSYLELAIALSLLQPEPEGQLFDIPGVWIHGGYRRVLWLACEESAGRLHHRAQRLIEGMGLKQPAPGSLLHLPARGADFIVTLQNVPHLVEEHNADAIIVDYLTGFRSSKDGDGNKISWDLDNDQAHEATRPLREIAATGVDVRLVHHANASGNRLRGASEWGNAVDTEIQLEDRSDGLICLKVEKQKDARKLKPFLLGFDWTDDGTTIRYAGEDSEKTLTPQEAAVVAYLEGVGAEGDPNKRTTASIADTLRVSRSRATEILGSAKDKKRVDSRAGKKNRNEWFAVSAPKSDTSEGKNG